MKTKLRLVLLAMYHKEYHKEYHKCMKNRTDFLYFIHLHLILTYFPSV